MLVHAALDLIGALLCNREGLTGITHLAVGAGDPAWDAAPPSPDPGRRSLVDEVWRVRLEPERDLRLDAEAGRIRVRATIPPGRATGTLREVGVFGGDASARPGTGVLVAHHVHAALAKPQDAALGRELVLTLPAALAPGARALVGGLLARRRGLIGLTYIAVGTSDDRGGEPVGALVAEAARKPLDPRAVAYDGRSRSVLAGVRFEVGEEPEEVREVGLLGGDATGAAGTGLLVVRHTSAPADRDRPARVERRFRLVLGDRTDVRVPDVAGRPLEEARTALLAAELDVGPVTERESDVQPDGAVLEQDPAPDAVVNAATAVALVLSTTPLIGVPDLVDADETDAAAVLDELGLTVNVDGRVEVESHAPPGTLLATDPAAGARVLPGTSVGFTVAVPVHVPVPDVRGRIPATAALLLSAVGLRVATGPPRTQESGATVGTILAQAPVPGQVVVVGSEVRLTLARPWSVLVPELTGSAPDAARRALAEAAAPLIDQLDLPEGTPGLALGAVSERAGPEPAGTIVSQSPRAGRRAPLYSTVDVVVAIVGTVPAPALVGLTESGARGAIAAAGFTLGRLTRRASEAPTDTVLDQEPRAGVLWPPGARVAITLAADQHAAVPDLVGGSLDAAREALDARGLTLGTPTTVVDPGPPGVVMDQDPEPGEAVLLGATVGVVVRAGVPDLVGIPERDARLLLETFGLALGTVSPREAEGAPGVVVAQQPAAGTAVDASTRVSLTVSVPVRVKVPQVVGVPLQEATRRCEQVGLSLVVGGQDQSDQAEGTVLGQTPAAGARVERATSVTVNVAAPRPRTVRVPRVTGVAVKAARLALADVGLRLEGGGSRPVAGVEAGTVVDQTPDAGAEVLLDSAVVVVLASSDVEVPDIQRLTQADATARLQSATLRLLLASRQASVTDAGIVLSQQPTPGQRVVPGSTVSVVVSAGGLVVVPNVFGLMQQLAVTRLQAAGLTADVEPDFDAVGRLGSVTDQTPGAGATVKSGAAVTIFVARRGLPDPGGLVRPQIEIPLTRPGIDPIVRPGISEVLQPSVGIPVVRPGIDRVILPP